MTPASRDDPSAPQRTETAPAAARRRRPRRTDTTDPHRSRERALKVLFQADVRGEPPLEALRRVVADPAALAMLDDTDLEVPDPGSEVARQARADAAAGTTLGPAGGGAPLDLFSRSLVEGVHDRLAELDELINAYARGWSVPRMPTVDRNVLRLALYELLAEDTAAPIVLDEALRFAKELSTDRSHRFINGVLEAIRRGEVAARGETAST